MDHFNYQDNILHAEDVAIPKIAKAVGTPFYCYSTATLVRHYHVFADAFKKIPTTICFAIKANSNQSVLKTLANEGAGGDAVSEGEIRRAIAAGIPAKKIVFSGVCKTQEEMAYALDQGIMQFNVESEPELLLLNEVALSKSLKAPIAIRINPDVDAKTHEKISTGKKENKFGVAWEQARDIYSKAAALEGIDVQAISTHIGSQLLDLTPFKDAFSRISELVSLLKQDGHHIKRLDLGGGLGIPYNAENPPSPADYADMTIEAVKHLDCELVFEPGRLIAGNSGILVSKVIYVKQSDTKSFTIIDAAMNDLIRPSLYDAYHHIIPVVMNNNPEFVTDFVGPVCETGDTFAKDYHISSLSAGDVVAFRSAGAYGAVMSNTYNSRLLIPEVLVKGNQFQVIRKRRTYDELIAEDTIADWL
ncbi:MAG: diaminopimelate decarboxylase [Rickettsiales bacterium]|nr:diaminopimelate decarboxylase [Rickettsiales bacterium]